MLFQNNLLNSSLRTLFKFLFLYFFWLSHIDVHSVSFSINTACCVLQTILHGYCNKHDEAYYTIQNNKQEPYVYEIFHFKNCKCAAAWQCLLKWKIFFSHFFLRARHFTCITYSFSVRTIGVIFFSIRIRMHTCIREGKCCVESYFPSEWPQRLCVELFDLIDVNKGRQLRICLH